MTSLNSPIGVVQYSKWDGNDIDTKEIFITMVNRVDPPQHVDVLIIALDQRHLTPTKPALQLTKISQIDVALSLKMGIVFGCNSGNADFSEATVPTKEYPADFPEDHYGNHRAAAEKMLKLNTTEQLAIKSGILKAQKSGSTSVLTVPPEVSDKRVLVITCTDTTEDLRLLMQALQYSTAGIIVLIGHGNARRVGSLFAEDICNLTQLLHARCVVLGSCCGGTVSKGCADMLPLVPFLGYPDAIKLVVPYAGLVTYLCSYYLLLSTRSATSIGRFKLLHPGLWGSGEGYTVPVCSYFIVLYKLAKQRHEETYPGDVVRLNFYATVPRR